MKKQFNFYMDSRVKIMIDLIRKGSVKKLQMLSDSQIVEHCLRVQAEKYGFKDSDNFTYYDSLENHLD